MNKDSNNSNMLTNESIKRIILNSKSSNQLNPNEAIALISTFIWEKKKVDITENGFNISINELPLLTEAYKIAAEYYEAKFNLYTLIKLPTQEHLNPTLLKVWFPE